HDRYHLDLRNASARAHLDEVVDRLVRDFGIGYFKLDYNINPGPGTDHLADTPGAGLLGHNRAHLAWLEGLLDRHPHLVLENCASGAMRADFAMLSRLQLQSTSDQQDPVAYPPIAASAPLGMLPEQAASWAYPQPEMSDEEMAFTLCTGLLGRMYLSGRVDAMSTAQQVLVAEAVAAHKRVRHDVAASHAAWPLGIDQWAQPWVALALRTAATTYLTLWRRPGAGAEVEVPLPHLAGGDVHVDTLFPQRLQPWAHTWDADRGVLTVTATDAPMAARTLRVSRDRPEQRVRVDAGATTGDVRGGATGMLYGLSEPGVPARELVAGVRPRTMAQKAPGGLQHPGGDAVEIADEYLAAGGSEIVVYLQDAYEQWPYEQLGIEDYRRRVRLAVEQIARRPDRDHFVYVPFNEGDWIWYADWSPEGRDRFLADWTTIHAEIRTAHPGARIVGPNEAYYRPQRVRDFLVHCRDHDVLPDIMSWHELQPSSLEVYPRHHAHHRALERELGVGPLPINIDEFGNRRDMSVPAQLLQWVEMLETTKVDGDLAYWTMAGNLDDHAVGTRQANGGWWLLSWYADLRGQTLAVTVPTPAVRDTVRALASLDAPAHRVTVLVGGGTDDVVL
ncbi:MAG TPA: glycoside hydrolase family 36 protein, partial [Actinomycetales bacterium]